MTTAQEIANALQDRVFSGLLQKLIFCKFQQITAIFQPELIFLQDQVLKLLFMNRLLMLLFLLGVGIFSCKSDSRTDTATQPAADETGTVRKIQTSGKNYGKLDEAFIQASKSQKAEPDLTDSLWHIYFALSIAEETPKKNIYEGHWLDLKEDGSYQKGIYDQTTDSGRFLYTSALKTLELRSERDSSSEWSVRVDPDAMLLIGTQKYGNNPWQIKLVRRSVAPSK